MASRYEEEDLSRIMPIPISARDSKVGIDQFVDPEACGLPGGPISRRDIERLFPDVLAGSDIKALAAAMRQARAANRTILWMIGAHVLKCGLSLYLRSLMKQGFITALATTGSAVIHDLELAFFGATSEDVARELPQGRFGMAQETAAHFESLCTRAAGEEQGLGEGAGAYIIAKNAPHGGFSVFAKAYERSVPATVHVAFGTDIVHQHPSFPAETAGGLTMRDFRIFTRTVRGVFDHGVALIWGSAVVLPEVFLKGVSVAYNVGAKPEGVTTASFDMLRQYRVGENVLARPFPGESRRYAFTGQHEIMLPLLYLLLTSPD
jgi:hypothetical protein